tara:strand:+ start:466 stop:2160 length:1695 start_codon:yes stop_codon:yes gene_type:complete
VSESCTPVSIYVGGSTGVGVGTNPFGKDIANVGLFRAIAKHSAHPGKLNFFNLGTLNPASLAADIFPGEAPCRDLGIASIFSQDLIAEAGCLLRGSADITDLAWKRRARGDRSYSIVGLVHTLAPPAIRQYIAHCLTSPVQPWDALICTSPSVKQGLEQMFGELGQFIGDRAGAATPVLPMPHLPVIPLGVDVPAIEGRIKSAGGRDGARAALGIAEDEILVLWLGRLSFYEKARPTPMFQAVESAARQSGKRIRFVMAGWFPNAGGDRPLYEEAARIHAPSVRVEFADGNNNDVVSRYWAGSDIFLSLVDNIQETFGITPVEAMAAGIPVVLSDWDGYRSTVRDGIDGIHVPTLLPPAGDGHLIVERNVLGLDNYLQYVSNVGQHTAVSVDAAAAAIAALASDPELRSRMGCAGQKRARERFDWPAIVSELDALWEDLAEKRNSAGAFGAGTGTETLRDPVKGDPFHAFNHFPTWSLNGDILLSASSSSETRLEQAESVDLDRRLPHWRAPVAHQVLSFVLDNKTVRFSEIEQHFQEHRGVRLNLLVTWMCKYGILNFSDTAP